MNEFNPIPYMSHPIIWYIGLIAASVLMLKGLLIIATEFIQRVPPMIEGIRDIYRHLKGKRHGKGQE